MLPLTDANSFPEQVIDGVTTAVRDSITSNDARKTSRDTRWSRSLGYHCAVLSHVCASPVFAECKGALQLLLLKWVKFGLSGHHLMDRHEDVVDLIVRGTVEGLVDDGMKEGVSTVQIAGPIAHDIV